MLHISPESSTTAGSSPATVAVVGGGLAGMAAAWKASQFGFRVELFERSKYLGGRAGSFDAPENREVVDYCRHAAMGCCSHFLDFCRETGIGDCFERTGTLHFIGPDGRQCDFSPARWLPPPLHLLPGLAKLKYLSLGERWKIVRAMRKLVNPKTNSRGLTAVGDWLRRHGQSQRAIDLFWSPVLVGALAETADHASLDAARKVFRDGFTISNKSSDLVLPTRPLRGIFHHRLGDRLAERGIKLHLGTPVRRIEGDGRSARAVVFADGRRREFGRFIVAVPWRNVRKLLDEELLAAIPSLADVDKIPSAAITSVHLWFDRQAVPLPHAVLPGRLSQWVFVEPPYYPSPPQHCQVVISASHRISIKSIKGSGVFISRKKILSRILDDLRAIWPAVGEAKLLHSLVITNQAAVFSCVPGLDEYRPGQKTPICNLALAGDWTATGWPGTMESAIRSGNYAVESLSFSEDSSLEKGVCD